MALAELLNRRRMEMDARPEDELSMEQLLSGIGKRPGAGSPVEQLPQMKMPQQMAAKPPLETMKEAAEPAKAKEISPAETAGIQAGASLLGGLLEAKSKREADLIKLKQQALQMASEGEQAGIAQAGQSRQNALAKLIQSYKASLT